MVSDDDDLVGGSEFDDPEEEELAASEKLDDDDEMDEMGQEMEMEEEEKEFDEHDEKDEEEEEEDEESAELFIRQRTAQSATNNSATNLLFDEDEPVFVEYNRNFYAVPPSAIVRRFNHPIVAKTCAQLGEMTKTNGDLNYWPSVRELDPQQIVVLRGKHVPGDPTLGFAWYCAVVVENRTDGDDRRILRHFPKQLVKLMIKEMAVNDNLATSRLITEFQPKNLNEKILVPSSKANGWALQKTDPPKSIAQKPLPVPAKGAGSAGGEPGPGPGSGLRIAQPTQPTKPVQPAQPAQPAQPNQPTQPKKQKTVSFTPSSSSSSSSLKRAFEKGSDDGAAERGLGAVRSHKKLPKPTANPTADNSPRRQTSVSAGAEPRPGKAPSTKKTPEACATKKAQPAPQASVVSGSSPAGAVAAPVAAHKNVIRNTDSSFQITVTDNEKKTMELPIPDGCVSATIKVTYAFE